MLQTANCRKSNNRVLDSYQVLQDRQKLTMKDINKLNELFYYCINKIGVSFSITYEESCDGFYIEIISPANRECYITKTASLEYVVDDAIKHLMQFGDGK